jgi:hypothetical protein
MRNQHIPIPENETHRTTIFECFKIKHVVQICSNAQYYACQRSGMHEMPRLTPCLPRGKETVWNTVMGLNVQQDWTLKTKCFAFDNFPDDPSFSRHLEAFLGTIEARRLEGCHLERGHQDINGKTDDFLYGFYPVNIWTSYCTGNSNTLI